MTELGIRRRGQKQDWVADKINRNPEKIRKTAEKHRGMKRSEESKLKMSLARIKYFESGAVGASKGRTKFFDLETRKCIYVSKDEIDKYKSDSRYTDEPLIRIVKDGKLKLIANFEPIPEGWIRYKKR